MLYAVSLETTQALSRGRARRRARVVVDAMNGDEAGRLALRRLRGRPEILRSAVRGVALLPPRPAPAPADGDGVIDLRGLVGAAARRRARAARKGMERT